MPVYRFGERAVPPESLIILNTDGSGSELKPALEHLATHRYGGYIRAEELAETRALCQTALRDVRAYGKAVQKVYVLSNSDFIVGRDHFKKNPDFLQLAVFWQWSFEAWENASPEELRKIRFIMPWQPPDQTKSGYGYMTTMIKRRLGEIRFPSENILDWTAHPNATAFNERERLVSAIGAVGKAPSFFGPCWEAKDGTLPLDCVEHAKLPIPAWCHLTELGIQEFWEMVVASEPDRLLRWYDIRPTPGFCRWEFNLSVNVPHMAKFWAKHPSTIPAFIFRYGRYDIPLRRNYLSEFIFRFALFKVNLRLPNARPRK